MFSSESNSKNAKVGIVRQSAEAKIFLISEMSVLNGSVSTNEPAMVMGTVEGSVSVENTFTLRPGGIVNGPVYCLMADISGTINGNVICRGPVVLRSKSSVTGDLQCTSLIMEKGVYFCGKVICSEPDMEAVEATVETNTFAGAAEAEQ